MTKFNRNPGFLHFLKKAMIYVILTLIAGCTGVVTPEKESEGSLMKKALPVWADGLQKEMNITLGFRGVFRAGGEKSYKLRITGSTLYRVYLNGNFIGYGPARAAHGYFRVDEYDLKDHIKKGKNLVAVEVAGYNVNTYYTLDQPSFLQAEVESEEGILLATGSGNDFKAFQIKERLQKVERYSFQRPFTEYYRMGKNSGQWKTSLKAEITSLKLAVQPTVKLIPRNILLPEFKTVSPVSLYARGTIQLRKPENYRKDRSLVNISEKLKGFREEELEVVPSQLMQEIVNKTQNTLRVTYSKESLHLSGNEFCTFDFGINLSGFIGGKISCTEPAKVVFYFDELLTDGDVNPKKRMPDINNQVVYELAPGDHHLEAFESYTFKYLKVIVLEGSCRLEDMYLREYAYPENTLASFTCSNNKLNDIYLAARQSFRQNAVDILMDCPSRERGGWLCDSYFAAFSEKALTGRSAVTHNFYESYAMADSFAFLPDGMIPMCYPADHNDSVFIPNWALWFIIQVDDYVNRGGDPGLAHRLQPRIEKLLDYFTRFENEDGLLESLERWIFVEWSKANQFVRDVNYPTNMLYSEALLRASSMYQNERWKMKAEDIRKAILKQSFNGNFFVDNAVRDKTGKLRVTSNTTEVCQYYAFFFNLATPESHPGLWKKLVTQFGPHRNDELTYPDVFKANAFMGNYFRMDILSRYGLKEQLLKEIQDYFHKMAATTGTLWEHMNSNASCNHGFASYLSHVIYRDILGISKIDYICREVTIQFHDLDMDECSGVLPVDDSFIELKWKRSGKKVEYSVKVPDNYKVITENRSSCELVQL